jgi:hypothetical protein
MSKCVGECVRVCLNMCALAGYIFQYAKKSGCLMSVRVQVRAAFIVYGKGMARMNAHTHIHTHRERDRERERERAADDWNAGNAARALHRA